MAPHALKAKPALMENYEPDGRNPDGRCDGNDDPAEYSQPRTHAVRLSGWDRPRMCRHEPNGDQPYRTNDHDQYASTTPHAASLPFSGRACIKAA